MRKREAGFTLIEIIVTLLLVGILSVFTGLFMNTFLSGYLMVKNNSDTAMKAQMALDRISIEMRDVSAITALTDNSLITYTNPSGVNRTISFQAPNIFLSTPAANNSILIDSVQAFQVSAALNNVYNSAVDDVAFIDIGFTVSGYNPFTTRIFPRTRIPNPYP